MWENKIKRYTWLHELEVDLELMNTDWWTVVTISDTGSRILVVYDKYWYDKHIDLDSNNNQDGEIETAVWEETMDANTWGTDM